MNNEDSLNNGCHQIHQYQQNKQLHLTLNHRTQKKDQQTLCWKSGYWLGTGRNMSWVKQVNRIPTLELPLLINGFLTEIQI